MRSDWEICSNMATCHCCVSGCGLHSIWEIIISSVCTHIFRVESAGGRHDIKMPFYQYRDSHVKDKTVTPTVLSLTWESPYLGKTVFIWRWGPGFVVLIVTPCMPDTSSPFSIYWFKFLSKSYEWSSKLTRWIVFRRNLKMYCPLCTPPCWNDFGQLKSFFRTDKTHLYLIVSMIAADDLTTLWRRQGITIHDIAMICLE